MRRSISVRLVVVLALAVVAACGGSDRLVTSGGTTGGPSSPPTPPTPPAPRPSLAEMEPNDAVATATPLALGEAGVGALDVMGDVDFWSVTVAAETYLRLELVARRHDVITWNTELNGAVLTLYDTDAVTKLAEHDGTGDVLFGTSALTGLEFDRDLDCIRLPAAGTYFVRVSLDDPFRLGGTYALVPRAVAVSNPQFEAEGVGGGGLNNTLATAEPIAVGTMNAYMSGGDFDLFSFEVTEAPAVASFEIKAWRHGAEAGATSYRKVEARVLDASGFAGLEGGPATFGLVFDPLVSQLIHTPGTYYLMVLDRSDGAIGPGRYVINHDLAPVGQAMESEPNGNLGNATFLTDGGFVAGTVGSTDEDWFCIAAQGGDRRAVQIWNGRNHSAPSATDDITVEVMGPSTNALGVAGQTSMFPYSLWEARFIAPVTGNYYVRITSATDTDYTLRSVVIQESGVESESNNTFGTPTPLTNNRSIAGTLNPISDEDWFSFTAEADEHVMLDCFGGVLVPALDPLRDASGSLAVPILEVYDDMGTQLAITGSSANPLLHGLIGRLPTCTGSFIAPADGTYFIRVRNGPPGGGQTHTYQIVRR